jgi:tetratricopeptide (TPR) repeat protein
MGDQRDPNKRLRVLLAEAGWSGGELARAVNAVAAESGIRLNYRRASTAQWLSGGLPRPPVPELVAEALSRVLERPITPSDAGLHLEGGPGDEGEGMVAERLVHLAGGTSRRAVLRHSVYSLALLAVPDLIEPLTLQLREKNDKPTGGREEFAAASAALRLFSDADGALGASMVRGALADYLAKTISPWLRTEVGSARDRQELFGVSAELAYLCGFMCFDDELHGSAQRYYRAALRLSAQAGDAVRYAITLRAMSVQARSLNHHKQAVQLAEASLETAGRHAPPQTRAFLVGQVAVAAAASGERRHATTSLCAVERALAGTDGAPTAIGAYHHGSFAHQRAAVAACLGDKSAAIAALRESIRQRPPGEYRSHAIMLARLAELLMDLGRLDEAVATWHRFLDIYPAVRSGRVNTAMGILRARTRSHQSNSMAKALSCRAAALSIR